MGLAERRLTQREPQRDWLPRRRQKTAGRGPRSVPRIRGRSTRTGLSEFLARPRPPGFRCGERHTFATMQPRLSSFRYQSPGRNRAWWQEFGMVLLLCHIGLSQFLKPKSHPPGLSLVALCAAGAPPANPAPGADKAQVAATRTSTIPPSTLAWPWQRFESPAASASPSPRAVRMPTLFLSLSSPLLPLGPTLVPLITASPRPRPVHRGLRDDQAPVDNAPILPPNAI